MFNRLVIFFIAFGSVAAAHLFAIEYFLYWSYTWIDIPIHMLGGIVVVLGLSILPFFNIHFIESRFHLRHVISTVLFVGIVWELFEVFTGISIHEVGYITDTCLDLLMDVAGGYIGYGIVQSVKKL